MSAAPGRMNAPWVITAARFAILGSGLVTAPLVARAVGPEGRGLTASALATLAILPFVLGVGLPMAVRRRAAIESVSEIVRTVRLFAFFLVVPATLLGLLAKGVFLSGLTGAQSLVFMAGAAATPLFISALADESVLIVRKQFLGVAIYRAAQPVVYFVIVVCTTLTGTLDVTWIIVAMASGTVASGVVGSVLVRVGLRGPRVPMRPLLRQGISYAGSELAEVSQNRLDQVVMVSLIGASQAGLYAVAVTLATLPVVLGHAVGAAVFREVANAQGAERDDLVARTLRAANLMGIVASASLAGVTPLVVPFLFGKEFIGAVPVTLIALAGSTAILTGYVATVLLGAEGAGRSMTLAQVAGVFTGIGLLFVLGPRFLAIGAAVASSLGYMLTYAVATRKLNVRLNALLPRRSDALTALQLLLGHPPQS